MAQGESQGLQVEKVPCAATGKEPEQEWSEVQEDGVWGAKGECFQKEGGLAVLGVA